MAPNSSPPSRQAPHDVPAPQLRGEHAGGGTDHGVPGGMAVGVVHLLQAVEIEERQRERVLVPAGHAHRLLQALPEMAAVEDAGQLVPGGQLLQPRVQPAGLRHVVRDPLHVDDLVPPPEHRVLGDLQATWGAVLVPHLHLDPGLGLAVQGLQ